MQLNITDIQRGCTHDGPGLRTVVFFKGCPLHCYWCHNPETRDSRQELFYRPEKCIGCSECFAVCPKDAHILQAGKHILDRNRCIACMACVDACPSNALEAASRSMDVSQLLRLVEAEKVFYRNDGGLTVSGGEPTMQTDGLLALLQGAKERDIHTCIETCGVFSPALVARLVDCTDLFLYDIKDTNPTRLHQSTGADLETVLNNLMAIDALGGKSVMRCILIPRVNLNTEHAHKLADIYHRLKNCLHIELLPYHPFGISKSGQLGKPAVRYREPEPQALEDFAAILTAQNIPTKLFGSLLSL